VDDLLIYASRSKLRRYQALAVAASAALPLAALAGVASLDTVHWVLYALLVLGAVTAVVVLEKRIRRPVPELRLSTKGIEGAFGLIAWDDVTGVELMTRLRLRARGVVIRLRPGALLSPPTRELAEVGDEMQQLFRDRLELETRHLELTPDELLREIERFRMYVSPNFD